MKTTRVHGGSEIFRPLELVGVQENFATAFTVSDLRSHHESTGFPLSVQSCSNYVEMSDSCSREVGPPSQRSFIRAKIHS